jgi:hypothetical protein
MISEKFLCNVTALLTFCIGISFRNDWYFFRKRQDAADSYKQPVFLLCPFGGTSLHHFASRFGCLEKSVRKRAAEHCLDAWSQCLQQYKTRNALCSYYQTIMDDQRALSTSIKSGIHRRGGWPKPCIYYTQYTVYTHI